MIARMGFLTRRPDMSHAEFVAHWRGTHGGLASRFPNLRRYEQNVVVDASQLAIAYARGEWSVDGISQLWFDDLASMDAAIRAPVSQTALGDNTSFIGRIALVACQTQIVKAPDEARPLLKRMSILTKPAHVTAAEFRAHWWGLHAELVGRFPRMAGYRQNLVVARGLTSDATPSADEQRIDGVVELFFESLDDLKACFASPQAAAAQRHAPEFIAEITTFLVKPHRVV